MTWTTFHRRGEVLRAVVDAADRRRDGLLPLDVPGVAETFRDDHDLLGALLLRWHTRLAGRVEAATSHQPVDLDLAVQDAWRAAAAADPGVLAIVDHYAAHPLDEAMATMSAISAGKGHELLAVSAGRCSLPPGPTGRRIGAELESVARAGQHSGAVPEEESATGSTVVGLPGRLFGRIRSALAA